MSKIACQLKFSGLLGLVILTSGCTSGAMPDLQYVIINIGNSIAPVYKLVTASSYLFGILFIFRGVFMLKAYGDMRTMMSSQANLKGALILLLVGAALLFFPSVQQTFLLTTFNVTSTSPLQYATGTTMNQSAYIALLRFVQLMGTISFIRGWVMLTHLSNQGQQASMGKALTHLFGGIMAINIQGTINLLKNTIGS